MNRKFTEEEIRNNKMFMKVFYLLRSWRITNSYLNGILDIDFFHEISKQLNMIISSVVKEVSIWKQVISSAGEAPKGELAIFIKNL